MGAVVSVKTAILRPGDRVSTPMMIAPADADVIILEKEQ